MDSHRCMKCPHPLLFAYCPRYPLGLARRNRIAVSSDLFLLPTGGAVVIARTAFHAVPISWPKPPSIAALDELLYPLGIFFFNEHSAVALFATTSLVA